MRVYLSVLVFEFRQHVRMHMCVTVHINACILSSYLGIFTCASTYICIHTHTHICMLGRMHTQFDVSRVTAVCGKAKTVARLFQAPSRFSSEPTGRVLRRGGNSLCNATVPLFQDLVKIFSLFFSPHHPAVCYIESKHNKGHWLIP